MGGNRVVFNIKGNDYRLVVQINYPYLGSLCAFCRDARGVHKIDVRGGVT